MIEGICPNCGRKYYGWALLEGNHTCGECGSKLLLNNLPATDRTRREIWLDAEYSLEEMDTSQN